MPRSKNKEKIVTHYPRTAKEGDRCHYKVEWTLGEGQKETWPDAENWVPDTAVVAPDMIKKYWEFVKGYNEHKLAGRSHLVPHDVHILYNDKHNANLKSSSNSKTKISSTIFKNKLDKDTFPNNPSRKGAPIAKQKFLRSIDRQELRDEQHVSQSALEALQIHKKSARERGMLSANDLRRALKSTASDYRYIDGIDSDDSPEQDERKDRALNDYRPRGGFNTAMFREIITNCDSDWSDGSLPPHRKISIYHNTALQRYAEVEEETDDLEFDSDDDST